ncbi:sporulation integral membrane protein YlbJ [Alkalihalobacillus sp. AL-G]|nr:sporulation integral membrane protein YlbJ [Alkalihalobacillus sp. AL-G]
MLYPKAAFESSLKGLTTWWEIVFPSLLPFFIISEILISFGVVRLVGVLLEPFMRPLFNVPGAGGFVWAMGISSGFPAGAKFTARLRQENELTQIEAERLVSFTNCSNPLFILVAISIGFFYNTDLGLLLVAAHYLGNIVVGLVMRFYGKDYRQFPLRNKKHVPNNRLKYALYRMNEVKRRDPRPFGKILGDAVQHSIQTLLMIGGFILLFSVLNRMLAEVNITAFLASVFSAFIGIIGFSQDLSIPFITGLLEITIGSQQVSEVNTPLIHQAIIVSFILAFNGFSVHAQVASILAETDIRFKPFFMARLLHGFVASVLTVLLWKPLYVSQSSGTSVVAAFATHPTISWAESIWDQLLTIGATVTFVSLVIYVLIIWRSLDQTAIRVK